VLHTWKVLYGGKRKGEARLVGPCVN
jgi:hypothetical protein